MASKRIDQKQFLSDLARDLEVYKDPQYRINAQQFFKEELKVKTAIRGALVNKLIATYWRRIRDWSKRDIFELCEKLLVSDLEARRGIAFDFAFRCRDDFVASDFARLERWVKQHVDNWGACDHICTRPLGHLVYLYPELVKRTTKWATSKNLWFRRSSAVCLIYGIRRERPLPPLFKVADILLEDSEDMVQKGYGWMLKVAADYHRDKVFDYVMHHKRRMPRTALRYAIEKMPKDLKKKAMLKDW